MAVSSRNDDVADMVWTLVRRMAPVLLQWLHHRKQLQMLLVPCAARQTCSARCVRWCCGKPSVGTYYAARCIAAFLVSARTHCMILMAEDDGGNTGLTAPLHPWRWC